MQQLAARMRNHATSNQAGWSTPVTFGLVLLVCLGMIVQLLAGIEHRQQLADMFGVHAQNWNWLAPQSYLTLLTNSFLHGSATHFIGNVSILLLLGVVVEKRVNRYAFIAAWFVSSVIAGLAHVLLFPDVTAP